MALAVEMESAAIGAGLLRRRHVPVRGRAYRLGYADDHAPRVLCRFSRTSPGTYSNAIGRGFSRTRAQFDGALTAGVRGGALSDAFTTTRVWPRPPLVHYFSTVNSTPFRRKPAATAGRIFNGRHDSAWGLASFREAPGDRAAQQLAESAARTASTPPRPGTGRAIAPRVGRSQPSP